MNVPRLFFRIIVMLCVAASVSTDVHDNTDINHPKRSGDAAPPKKTDYAVTTNRSRERSNLYVDRITKRVVTTLEQVDMSKLRSEELIFLEDSWTTAFQTIFGNIQIRSIIITDDQPTTRNMLRSRRTSWYDVWAVAEFYACSYCGDDDDDFQPWHRQLVGQDEAPIYQSFDNLFCQFLRDGSFERFQDVGNCHVEFSDE